MKNIYNVILLLILSQTVLAQPTAHDLVSDSTRLFIEFADYTGYTNDSIYTNLRKGSLFLGSKAAIYLFKDKPIEEYLQQLRNAVKDESLKDGVVNGYKERFDLEKIHSTMYIRYYGSPDFLLFKARQDGDVFRSDTLYYVWEPINEFKTIVGYRCQKALNTASDGNQVTAWFTEEIPLSAGPLYLSGLPGAILEYHNPKTKRLLRAVTISSEDIPEQKFRNWLNAPIVSKAEYAEIYEKGLKEFQRFRRMIDGEKTTNH